ncbi:MAG TPA: reverse transcriptase family protein [Bacteroidia bacterium]|nr:reverse transcriptase family protein [Bacteroidia bacterium]
MKDFAQINACREVRPGGGVSLYVRNTSEILYQKTFTDNTGDVQLVKALVKKNDTTAWIIVFYSRSIVTSNKLIAVLDKELQGHTDRPTFLLGDSNINLLDHNISQDYVSLLSSKGMISCINNITRPSSGTCLDHIWAGCYPQGTQLHSGIVKTFAIADHFPVFICIHLNSDPPRTVTTEPTERRVFSTANFQKFSDLAYSLDWSEVLKHTDTNHAISCFNNTIYTAYNRCFPIRRLHHISQFTRGPWYTDQLRLERKMLNRHGRAIARAGITADKKDFNRSRRAFRSRVKQAYRCYHSRTLNKVKGHPRKLWKHLNSCLGRTTNGGNGPSSISYNGANFLGPSEVAEGFCDYFSNIGADTVKNLQTSASDVVSLDSMFNWNYDFRLVEIDAGMVIKLASNMKADLKGSLSSVPSLIIRQNIELLIVPILHIFNMSIAQGYFPDIFKETHVIPLYKGKGEPNCPSSYRPIAITSFLAKLLERCVKQQLERLLENTSFFSNSQYGFRRCRSTSLALCSMSDYIAAHCEGGNAVLGLYLDIAKAFDCIPHDILLDHLQTMSSDNITIKWFKSYLSERLIKVRIGEKVSREKPVRIGVPQGSVLGPFLFIIYINSILTLIQSKCPGTKVVTYADDTTILFKIDKQCPDLSIITFNEHIGFIHNLFTRLRLAINVSKTKCLLFKTAQCKIIIPDGSIKMNNNPIIFSDETECLGITFSNDIKWKAHLKSVSKKCYAVISSLARLRQIGYERDFLFVVYKSLFVPVISYGISVWGSSYDMVIRKFQTIQNDALRAIMGSSRCTSVRSIFKQYNILNIKNLSHQQISLLMYKHTLGVIQLDFIEATPVQESRYRLRSCQTGLIHTERVKSVLREQSPSIKFVTVWNSLPPTLKSSTTIASFKKNLVQYLVNCQ